MRNDPPIERKALEVHHRSVAVDLHADTATLMRFGYDLFSRHRPLLPLAALGYHLDLPRMKKGGLSAQFFGLVTFPLTRVGLFDSAMQQIRLLWKGAEERPDLLQVVSEAHEIEGAKIDGRVGALFGLEGAHALEGDLHNLTRLAEHGLRYIGLTHFTKNKAALPAFGLGSSQNEGLSSFGRDLIARSNELGVLLDLAHINRKGFMEAVKMSTDPVIVSHTGLDGVHSLWRNIDDQQIRAVADTGGCVGIIFSRHFLGGPHLSKLVDHILHCLDVGGEDCPALGSDFDGLIVPPKELRDVSALPRLTQALLERGLEERVVQKILGGNVLRVLRQVPARHFLSHTRRRTSS